MSIRVFRCSRVGETLPVTVCVQWSVEWGRGTAGEGREGVRIKFYGDGHDSPSPPSSFSPSPHLPTSTSLCLGLCPGRVCGCMEVGEGGSDM